MDRYGWGVKIQRVVGRKRHHVIPWIYRGPTTLWQSETSVCGLTGPFEEVDWQGAQVCNPCLYGTVPEAFAAAPPELRTPPEDF